jgi:hypothetical protein
MSLITFPSKVKHPTTNYTGHLFWPYLLVMHKGWFMVKKIFPQIEKKNFLAY